MKIYGFAEGSTAAWMMKDQLAESLTRCDAASRTRWGWRSLQ